MTVRWGVLGTGGIARTFIKDGLAAGVEFSAVGSRTDERAREFASEFGIPVAHGSYSALVQDAAVDAVYIATPHPMHAGDAVLAIQGGKHVLVEKPFTLNAPEAQRVFTAADEHDVVAMEAMWTRFLPQTLMMRKAIEEGRIGRPRVVIATHNQKLTDDPNHRLNNPALGGGALLDLGVYPVSFAIDVLGAPSSVLATGRLNEQGVDIQGGIVINHGEDTESLVHFARDLGSSNSATIIGDDGRIDIDSVWYRPTTWRIRDASGTVVEEFDSREELGGYEHEARALESVIAAAPADRIALTGRDNTLAAMETLDDARRQLGVQYPNESTPGVPA